MGVSISSWQLANTVSQLGHLGVVSGTGMGIVLIARLTQGDPGEHVRRALRHFPFPDIAQAIADKYYVPEGTPGGKSYKRPPMWTTKPSLELNQISIVSNFVEVFLAKEGHTNPVGLNLLEKVQLPNISSLYGAMLAGVDYVIMGAGIPLQVPGTLDALAEHQPVSYRIDVEGAGPDDDFRVHLDPEQVFPGIAEKAGPLKRPQFLPIISSVVLGQALLKRSNGEINGFVVEMPTAGGHNAPPRGAMQLNEDGEPIYGPKDDVRIDRIRDLGLPFWLAGGYGSPQKFKEALEQGAAGIQVGTAFAYSNESGMDPAYREQVIRQVLNEEADVFTDPRISPTGYPFKVVQLDTTISNPDLYAERPRICDVGYLRTAYKTEDGKVGYRCPSEPVDQYIKKGGKEEDTVGRGCLCNNLGAAAGFPNVQKKTGYMELPVITSGDDLHNIVQFLKPGEVSYSAADVIKHLLGENNHNNNNNNSHG